MRRVLIVVDQNREATELLSQYLVQDGHSVQSSIGIDSALHRFKAWKPHLILIDTPAAHVELFELVQRIRALTRDDYTSVIWIASHFGMEDITLGSKAGIDDYLKKPFEAEALLVRVRAMLRFKEVQDALKRAVHRIEELSSTDDLTGLMNMRAAYRKGDEEILRSKRFRKPISAILLNLDAFSTVNQSVGFLAGNKILQEVSVRIKQCLRSIDLLARVGADEFFILLSETDLASAEFMAERIRDMVQSESFKGDKQSIQLTATLGVAGLTPDQSNQRMDDLLHIATEALRSAKANGTNRVEVYSFT